MKTSNQRLATFQVSLDKNQAALVSKPSSIFYLASFETLLPGEREAFLLVTHKKSWLLHTHFSPVVKLKNISYKTGISAQNLQKHIQEIAKENNIKNILINQNNLLLSEYKAIKKINNLKIELNKNLKLQKQITIKDKTEQDKIRTSAEITSQALKQIIKNIKIGMSEVELRESLEEKLRQLGCRQTAFPTIVAFGENTALPHHQPTAKTLKKEMPILIDVGAKINHYCADMTRTFWFGDKPSAQFTEVENVIKRAYSAVINKLEKNPTSKQLTAATLDQAARKVITDAGYGPNFIHTTGHGLGLEIHEQPSINSRNQTKINPGLVITIEPGIYLENKFGYRHENTVLVTKKGIEELTHSM